MNETYMNEIMKTAPSKLLVHTLRLLRPSLTPSYVKKTVKRATKENNGHSFEFCCGGKYLENIFLIKEYAKENNRVCIPLNLLWSRTLRKRLF